MTTEKNEQSTVVFLVFRTNYGHEDFEPTVFFDCAAAEECAERYRAAGFDIVHVSELEVE